MKKLGLVGGISWISTIEYYRYINETVNDRLGGLNYAECIIYSLNFDDFQKNNTSYNWEATFQLILHAAQCLQKSGADAIILCANTAHAVSDRIEKIIPLPIIHITEVTAMDIRNLGINKVGLLGTRFTMEMDFYKNKLLENKIESLVPEKFDRNFLQQTIKEELARGIVKAETKMKYINIINDLIKKGAEGIILGCTELPLILNQSDVSVPVFDTTRIHAMAAVNFILG